ncbi:MAG: hypothetical protein DLM62_06305 [Pseudonocardiales bacterium]|nr:MAG: hypothetical protein DLM62_06305 [Pseudonocardiales bacterium]
MTDGTYTGLDDTSIIALLTSTATRQADPPDGDGDESRDDRNSADGETIDDSGPDDGGSGDGAAGDDSTSSTSNDQSAQPARTGVGMELRVRLSTLLGLDQYSAELAGWGYLHAELARELTSTLGGARWRFALTDEQGQLTHSGTTYARATGISPRSAASRAIVELQVPTDQLRTLATDTTNPNGWAEVITDLFRQLENRAHLDRHLADGARRAPGAALRRELETRDRHCTMIGCRAPARTADKDHTLDHAKHGPTSDGNLGNVCRHDHRLKHEGGWTLQQPKPGNFRWIRVNM